MAGPGARRLPVTIPLPFGDAHAAACLAALAGTPGSRPAHPAAQRTIARTLCSRARQGSTPPREARRSKTRLSRDFSHPLLAAQPAGKGTARKNAREPREGSSRLVPSSDPCPSLPPRDASPVSIGKDRYQNDDEDDPKPGRHSDPFLGKRVESTRNGWPAAGSKPRDSSALPERFPASCRPCVSLEPSRPARYGRWGRGSSATLPG
jgi:hypothetical protein